MVSRAVAMMLAVMLTVIAMVRGDLLWIAVGFLMMGVSALFWRSDDASRKSREW